MELHHANPANMRSSTSSFTTTFHYHHSPKSLTKTPKKLSITSSKKIPESNNSLGLQKSSKTTLSRILRTEAAIKAIERKANSKKYNNLWPKAVLEALDDAIKHNKWESALKIFGLLHQQHWYEPRCQTYAKLLVMLGKCRQPNQASLLFEVMRSDGLEATIDVYTALVSAYGLSGLLDEAFQIVDEMKSVTNCQPDVYTYTVLIKCCTRLRRFDMIGEILNEMSYFGVKCSTVTYNTIIDGYGKAELFKLMETSLTDMIESGTCLPDIFTFNSVIGAYGNSGRINEMEKWFDEFLLMGVQPDVMTFNILIKSYGKSRLYEKMGSVINFMRKRFYAPTTVTYNIIIETFGKVGNIEKMEEFFLKMKHQGMKPNSVTYSSLVSAYGKAGLLEKVDSIVRQIENSDVILDTAFFNCGISAYGQAGDIEKMVDLYLAMKEHNCKPDNITSATMIQAYNAQGMIKAAQHLESKKRSYLDAKTNKKFGTKTASARAVVLVFT